MTTYTDPATAAKVAAIRAKHPDESGPAFRIDLTDEALREALQVLTNAVVLGRPHHKIRYMAPETYADTVYAQLPIVVNALLEDGVVYIWRVHRDQELFDYIRDGLTEACNLVAQVPGVEFIPATAVPETPADAPVSTSD